MANPVDTTTPMVAMPADIESDDAKGAGGRLYRAGDISVEPSPAERKLGGVAEEADDVGERVTAELTTTSNQRSFGFKLLSNNKAAPYSLTKCKRRG